MPGMHTPIFYFSAVALACALAPAHASAATAPVSSRGPRVARERTCAKAPVEVVAGAETATFPLTKCDGTALASAVDELSILGRPGTAPRPTEPLATLAKIRGSEIAPGVRRLDSRLVQRLQLAVDHFSMDGRSTKLVVVSGYRPKNSGSYHSAGRALDFRIDGVKNEDVVAFCKTLPDTGCGSYPNNVFVHMDVREPGTGHVSWVNASSPERAGGPVAAAPSKDSPPVSPEARKDSALNREAAKDSPPVSPEASENAKTDRSESGPKPAGIAAATGAPGLLMARPVAPAPSESNQATDKPNPVADDKAGVAKDEKLPALPAEGRHRAKHKHKTRKVRDQQRFL